MASTATNTNASPLTDLTGFQRDTLVVVAREGAAKGLAIKNALADIYDEDIHAGRLYPNLDELVDKGLVEKTEADGRTNHYSITRRGERKLAADRAWRTEDSA
jgi:DNA-binding PadR family transcriptional regulator